VLLAEARRHRPDPAPRSGRGASIYRNTARYWQLAGAIGISGDGIDQDDLSR
jgi:hypothetical protein